ncbi:hypothetical protein [Prosthecobacter sp.]|uniref:hypothetical protein n=1 Tax=Prosthecobacter sp. TaxID=1965333 RepID=UPI001E123E8B|nr:hypothetical protein [Prosthecobacter sp.]MCB1276440.1 hypothetical protein [Prosthecobacter sp.]
MNAVQKSSAIPHDEVWLERLRDPQRAEFALNLALKEFKKDRDMDSLLDVLRLVIKAQEG